MELARTTTPATNRKSADRRSSETINGPSPRIVQSSPLKTCPEQSTFPLTHNVSSEASEPTQASSAGLLRSEIIIPRSAPAPHREKINTSINPSALIIFLSLPLRLRQFFKLLGRLEQQEHHEH